MSFSTLVHKLNDFFGPMDRHLDLDDRRKDFLVEDVLPQGRRVATSLISRVRGLFFSKGTFAIANACVIF